MEMQGSRELAVTQQQAWDALNDPEVLKACIAGCEKLEASGDNAFSVGVALKIGPMAARFTGKVTLADIHPPERYTLSFEGQGGPAGFGKGQSLVTLTPGATGCVLTYTVQAQVGGKIAQMGQRLIDGVAKSMAEDFFKRFDAEMQRRHPAPQTPAEAPAPSVPAAEAASAGLPAWVWGAGVLVVLAAGYFLMR